MFTTPKNEIGSYTSIYNCLTVFSQVQDVATNTIPTHQHANDRSPISQKQRFPKQ